MMRRKGRIHGMDSKLADTIQTVVFFAALAQGVVPFVAKAMDWAPVWSLPRRLDAPAWWIVSLLVILAAAVIIAATEVLKRRTPSSR